MKQTIELEVKNGQYENFSLNIPTNRDFHLKVTLYTNEMFFFADLFFKQDSSQVRHFPYYLGMLTGICLGQAVNENDIVYSISDIDGLFVFELQTENLGE